MRYAWMISVAVVLGCSGEGGPSDPTQVDLSVTVSAPTLLAKDAQPTVTVTSRCAYAPASAFDVTLEAFSDAGMSTSLGTWTWGVAGLAAGATDAHSETVTLATGSWPGTAYWRATIDTLAEVDEYNEGNNEGTDSSELAVRAELSVEIVSAPGATNPGEWHDYTITLRNTGDVEATAGYAYWWVYPGIPVAGGGSPLGTITLAAGASQTVTHSIQSPGAAVRGQNNGVRFGVDTMGAVTEYDETNNADEATVWVPAL